MLKKPKTKSDLLSPFDYIGEDGIGEDGWESKLRQLLVDYEIPLSSQCNETAIADCEKRLGFVLPQSLKLFLSAFGPVDFGGG